jgi:hypothetical protein
MYYKGNNIGLNYDAATGTWVFNNEPQDFVDTNAFTTADPEFEMAPVVDDEEEEEVQCPEGYIYDNTLKQCVPDPSVQNRYTETTNDGNNNDQPSVQIAGTDRFTTDNNFIASDAEYNAMSGAELIENYKQRGYIENDPDSSGLIINLNRGVLGDAAFDASLKRVSGVSEYVVGGPDSDYDSSGTSEPTAIKGLSTNTIKKNKIINNLIRKKIIGAGEYYVAMGQTYVPETLMSARVASKDKNGKIIYTDKSKIKINAQNANTINASKPNVIVPGFGNNIWNEAKSAFKGYGYMAEQMKENFKLNSLNTATNYNNYLKESGVGDIRGGQEAIREAQEKEKLKKAEYDTQIKAIEARRKADQLRREAEQNQKDKEKEEREEREIKDFTNLNTGQSTTDSSGDTYTKKDDGGYTFTPSKPNVNTSTKTYENKRKYGGYTGSTAGRGGTTKAKSSPSKPKMTTPNPHTRSGFSN